MSRSFVAGSVVGAAVGLVGLASVSLMSPLEVAGRKAAAPEPEKAAQTDVVPEAPADAGLKMATAAPGSDTAPQPEILDVPAGSEFMRPKTDDKPAVPAAEPAPAQPAAPVVAAATAEPAPALTELTPPAPPETSQAAPATATKSEPAAENSTAVPAPDAAIASGVAAETPAPDLEKGPQETGVPVATVSGAGQAGRVPAGTATEVSPAAPAAGTAPTVPSLVPAPAEPAASPTVPGATGSEAGAAPTAETATTKTASGSSAAKVIDLTPRAQPVMDGSESGATADESAPASAPADAAASADLPQPGLVQTVPGVKVNRLPTIGAIPSVQPVVDSHSDLPQTGSEAAADKPIPALIRFAAKFQNPEHKPILAIMLLDVGVAAGGLDANALAGLPFAVTIAVDPLRPDATSAAAAYRAAGSEVAIMAGDMPAGATPADLEVAYQSYAQALPGAVALTGTPSAEFQRSSQIAQHLAELLAADGRGMIGYQQGLNPAERAAEKAHIGHASIEKLFGQAEDNTGTLGRELDRAAFSAGQKGAVAIALPATPEAVTGLIAWVSGPSAGSVAIAPVSAVMGTGE